MHKHTVPVVVFILAAAGLGACGRAEAEKAAAAAQQAQQKAFMEAEAQARTAQDEKERAALIQAATERCDGKQAAGCTDLGALRLTAKDAVGARQAFGAACSLGNAGGCMRAAQNSATPADALEAYRKACDLDDADGCVQAVAALDAVAQAGGTADAAAQAALLDKACALGMSRTCTALGVLSLEADPKAAAGAFDRGCTAKEPTSCLQLAGMHKRGLGGLKRNDKKAAAFAQQACDLGLADACAKP